MTMNLVIQERRKQLGLTQEQVAEHLNVSAPAVSKWETGVTSPDIGLLPQLARLLKVDLNTLFCFQENLTEEEIGLRCRESHEIFQTQGIEAAFAFANEQMGQFPHNDGLRYYLAVQMEANLRMSPLAEAEAMPYETLLLSWYERLSDSPDFPIRNSAKYMLASGHIRRRQYDKAQEILDSMPDRQTMMDHFADKRMLQVTIYQHQGKAELAVKELQQDLLLAAQRLQLLLGKLLDAEISAGNLTGARKIAEKSEKLPALLDLWEYSAYTASLQIALLEKNEERTVALLKELLSALTASYDFADTCLYYTIPTTGTLSTMLPMILRELQQDTAYDFLRENEAFLTMISQYQ